MMRVHGLFCETTNRHIRCAKPDYTQGDQIQVHSETMKWQDSQRCGRYFGPAVAPAFTPSRSTTTLTESPERVHRETNDDERSHAFPTPSLRIVAKRRASPSATLSADVILRTASTPARAPSVMAISPPIPATVERVPEPLSSCRCIDSRKLAEGIRVARRQILPRTFWILRWPRATA